MPSSRGRWNKVPGEIIKRRYTEWKYGCLWQFSFKTTYRSVKNEHVTSTKVISHHMLPCSPLSDHLVHTRKLSDEYTKFTDLGMQ